MQFYAAASNRNRLVTSDVCLEQAFKTLDKNQDGFLTKEEFKRSFGYKS